MQVSSEDDEEVSLEDKENEEVSCKLKGAGRANSVLTSWLGNGNGNKRKTSTSNQKISVKRTKGRAFRCQQASIVEEANLTEIIETPLEAIDFSEYQIDLSASKLLPCDTGFLQNNSKTLSCVGDGNCMFRAVSLLLCGNEERYMVQLRKLVCDYIEENVENMANHKAFTVSVPDSKSANRNDDDFVFVQSLSAAARDVWYK